MDVPLETIERAKAGNLQAREELLRAFAGPLRALVRRWGSPADPEDQLQELFAKLLRVLPQFEVAGAARLSTWIFTVAHRALLEQRRRPQLNVVPLEQAKQIADQQCIHRTLEEEELRRCPGSDSPSAARGDCQGGGNSDRNGQIEAPSSSRAARFEAGERARGA